MDISLNVRRFLLVGSIACLPVGQAHSTVIVTSAIRSVTATVLDVSNSVESLDKSGVFDQTATADAVGETFGGDARARQVSSIGALIFSGNGRVSIDVGGDTGGIAQANSTFVLDLDLDTSYFFDLFVSFDLVLEGSGQSSFTLDGPGTNIQGGALDELSESGTLGPGSYHLETFANVLFFGESSNHSQRGWNFTLTLREIPTTEVPAPGSLALLSLGLAGLALSRRKRA